MISSVTNRLADDLSTGILNQNDPQIVADGAPAYLILIDGMVERNPESIPLLSAGARLYGVYATVFVTDTKRSRLMTDKALKYASQAMCLKLTAVCASRDKPFDEFEKSVAAIGRNQVPLLYNFAVAWAGWISTRTEDWNAIAVIPRVRVCLEKVVSLNPEFDKGEAQLYLGVMATLLPPTLGGKPEKAKAYFDNALRISREKNLMVKVLYAERYARLVFNQRLHDRLLNEVLAAEAEWPGYTLTNTIAKQQAQKLLSTSKEYF